MKLLVDSRVLADVTRPGVKAHMQELADLCGQVLLEVDQVSWSVHASAGRTVEVQVLAVLRSTTAHRINTRPVRGVV